jgi:hypothetical protein
LHKGGVIAMTTGKLIKQKTGNNKVPLFKNLTGKVPFGAVAHFQTILTAFVVIFVYLDM